MQTFKAISFNDQITGKSRSVSIAFTSKEQPFYETVEKLTSQEIRNLIGINSYNQLCDKAHEERRNLSQLIKLLLEKALTDTDNFIPASDMTFKNSKCIPFQRWYPYIEGYSPDFVTSIITRHLHQNCIIYDPFAGTGTTIYAADSLGYDTYYSEINPLLQFLIKTKTTVLKMPLADRLDLCKQLQGIFPQLLRFNEAESGFANDNYKRVFKKSVYFPSENYSKILKTKTFIDKMEESPLKSVLLTAVLSSLIPASLLKKQGDLRFKTKQEQAKGIPDFAEILSQNVNNICNDLKNPVKYAMKQNHTCIIENAKKIKHADCAKIGCVITSPPYLNGTNYIRNTKLELWFLGYLKSDKDLRHYRDEILTSGINDVRSSTQITLAAPITSPLYKETINLLKENAYDARIPQMAQCYFSEMHGIFDGLKSKLEKGADLFIDIGDSIFNNVHVKTDMILQEIAESMGYTAIENRKLRERRSKNGQTISQKLIHLKYIGV